MILLAIMMYGLKKISQQSEAICFAWGNFKEATERAKLVNSMFPLAICLTKNKNGTPKHPLYVAADTKPLNF